MSDPSSMQDACHKITMKQFFLARKGPMIFFMKCPSKIIIYLWRDFKGNP